MSRLAPAALPFALVSSLAFGTLQAQSAPLSKHTGDTPEARRATNALNLLEAQGYCADLQSKSASAFDRFEPQGDGYAARVSQNGRTFTFTVDPETGRITEVR